MGGQGFIPEDGEGGLVEGSKEAKERREEHAYEQPHFGGAKTPGDANASGAAKPSGEARPSGGAAPRAGMQGKVDRGAAPDQRLDRPGTSPQGQPGSGAPAGGRVDGKKALDHGQEP